MDQTAENEVYLNIKLNNLPKEYHIMLIKSICLKGVEFILPERFSSPKIAYTVCFINDGNFSITHTMFVIVKVSIKWCWFNKISLIKLLWVDLQLLNLDQKLLVLSVYCFEHALHEKRYAALLEWQFRLLGLMQCSLWVLKDLNLSVAATYLHISHLKPLHDLQQPLFFLRGVNLVLRRMLFKLLAHLNPIIGTFSKTFPCSLSSVNTKCISDSMILSFKVFKFLLSFLVRFSLLKTSDL